MIWLTRQSDNSLKSIIHKIILILTVNGIQIEDGAAFADIYGNIGNLPESISAVHAGGNVFGYNKT